MESKFFNRNKIKKKSATILVSTVVPTDGTQGVSLKMNRGKKKNEKCYVLLAACFLITNNGRSSAVAELFVSDEATK